MIAMRTRLLHVGIVLASSLLVATPLFAGDGDPNHRKIVRDAERVARKDSWRAVATFALRVAKDPSPGLRTEVGMTMLEELSKRRVRLIAVRNEQGEKLFKHFVKYLRAYYVPRKVLDEQTALQRENGSMSNDIERATKLLGQIQEIVRNASAELSPAEERSEWTRSLIRGAISSASKDVHRALIVDALRGAALPPIRDELHRWAAISTNRDLALASLRALESEPSLADVEALTAVAAHKDSFVRRAVFRVLAEVRDTAAMDVLFSRLDDEVGIPFHELVEHLTLTTGETFGESRRAWTEWWEGHRGAWQRPDELGDPSTLAPRTATTRYFGLELASARVLFVLDTSGSMDWRMNMREGMLTSRADRSLPRKIDAAREELLTALDQLDETAWFSIVTFGTEVDTFSRRLVKADGRNQRKARKFVEDLRPSGVTNWSEAMLVALDATERSSSVREDDFADTIVILCDGEPNCGPIAAVEDVLEEVRRRNPQGMLTVHSIFLGVDGSAGFLKRLAEQNGGQFVQRKR